MKDEATRASEAALPETIEGLRRQNSAYRALCASLEAQMSVLTEKGREYQEAVTTLDSEREANAILTAENARLTEERDALALALQMIARGKYDGLEAERFSAIECRVIASAALAKVKGAPDAR